MKASVPRFGKLGFSLHPKQKSPPQPSVLCLLMAQKHFFRSFMTGRVITHSNGFWKGKNKNKKSQKQNKNSTPLHSLWQTFSNSFLSMFIETYPPTLLTTWKHTPSCRITREKKKASRYNKHEFTWTNSHTAMNKVDKSITPFSSTPLWQGVYTWSNRHGKHTAGVFGPFLSCAMASNVVTTQVSGSVFKLSLKTRYKQKRISQVVATAAQRTATEHRCAEVPVSGSVQPYTRACDCVGG